MALFNDKFTATIDYFDESRSGIYMERAFLPGMVGLDGNKPYANVGEVNSKGFDGNFSYKQKISDVKFTVRGNIIITIVHTVVKHKRSIAFTAYIAALPGKE